MLVTEWLLLVTGLIELCVLEDSVLVFSCSCNASQCLLSPDPLV